MKPPKLMKTYGHLEDARWEWKEQLAQVEDEEISELNLNIIDIGIEVLTYINQARAKIEKIEELLNEE